MPKRADITGQRYGRLVAVERVGADAKGNAHWRCTCDCGTERVVALPNLRGGRTVSCGCFASEQLSRRSRTHGEGDHKTREYRVWAAMKRRCNNPRVPEYRNYGARGIKVCERWERDYCAFIEDMGRCPPGLTLERIDNDKGYGPANCKWATYAEQSANRRCSVRALTPPSPSPSPTP